MKVVAWIRDWTIISVGPWLTIYLFWHGPILAGLAAGALLAFALASRISRQ